MGQLCKRDIIEQPPVVFIYLDCWGILMENCLTGFYDVVQLHSSSLRESLINVQIRWKLSHLNVGLLATLQVAFGFINVIKISLNFAESIIDG